MTTVQTDANAASPSTGGDAGTKVLAGTNGRKAQAAADGEAARQCLDCPAPVTGKAVRCPACKVAKEKEQNRASARAYRARKARGETGGTALVAQSGQAPAVMDYDTACRAIAEATTIDAAKDIADKAEALRAYAKQANNRGLEIDAAEIRIRAERRLGEKLFEIKSTEGLHAGGRPEKTPATEAEVLQPLRLLDLGIDHKLSARAQKLAALPDFDARIGKWRDTVGRAGERVTVRLLTGNRREARRENDAYYTPPSIVAEIARRWKPAHRRQVPVWEPCAGDGRLADGLAEAGHLVMRSDVAVGIDFFAVETLQRVHDQPEDLPTRICTNPPYERMREFIDHAFGLGVREMCLVLPERAWACGVGREQFERHRPAVWANLDWREDYLGRGGSADRALAVAIWTSPCANACEFQVWGRGDSDA